MAAVGRLWPVTESDCSSVSRCAVTKKNSLSLRIGPPTWAPQYFKASSGLGSALVLFCQELAFRSLSRKKYQAPPWKVLVPAFRMAL